MSFPAPAASPSTAMFSVAVLPTSTSPDKGVSATTSSKMLAMVPVFVPSSMALTVHPSAVPNVAASLTRELKCALTYPDTSMSAVVQMLSALW